MSNLLEVDSIIKSFNNHQILTDIYLKCQTNDIIGLLGRNGTGKTTFFKILFGTLSSERKFIRINNHIYNKLYKSPSVLCYLPQDTFIPKQLTVRKTIDLYLKNNLIEFLEDNVLNKLINSKISQLSGGELRYFEIKLLLNLNTKFAILDEPFNGLSPILVELVKKLILKSSTKKGIILTDHDYKNVLDIANHVYLIYDGGFKKIDDKNELERWGYTPESRL